MHLKKQGMLVNEASLCAKIGGNGLYIKLDNIKAIDAQSFSNFLFVVLGVVRKPWRGFSISCFITFL